LAGNFYGADIAQLRQLAGSLRSAGRRLDRQRQMLAAGVGGTRWPGPDAERFRGDWTSGHSRSLSAAAAFLDAGAETVLRHAAEQEQASSGGVGSPGHSVSAASPGGSSGGSAATPSPDDIKDKLSVEVRDWWLGLTAAQQEAFIRSHPDVAGNTNGIPFGVRTEANRLNAQARIDWLENHDPEPRLNPWILDSGYPARYAAEHEAWRKRQDGVKYLQKVVEGKIRLAAYDPGRSSITELIGDYNADTTTVITYVPGTFTNEASFYEGKAQELAQRLVRSDESGRTAAFVYKGSEFPDGDPIEALLGEANNDEFVAATGPVLQEFQDAVDLERAAPSQSVGVGHSWGLRNLTAAEIEGARFDKLIALSGAAIPPGWVPSPGTDYTSFTYPDLLLAAETAGLVGDNYPMKEPAFEKHVYEPPGGSRLSEYYSIDNHSLIASTDPRNERPLEDLREEILSR